MFSAKNKWPSLYAWKPPGLLCKTLTFFVKLPQCKLKIWKEDKMNKAHFNPNLLPSVPQKLRFRTEFGLGDVFPHALVE